jgi:hypothetical protein
MFQEPFVVASTVARQFDRQTSLIETVLRSGVCPLAPLKD